jgi:SagB-type dehydrogenase family enzyme
MDMDGRDFLKANWHLLDGYRSDQMNGVEHPPVQKQLPEGTPVRKLPPVRDDLCTEDSLPKILDSRRSIRRYADIPLTLDQLSFLLWYTQGVQKVVRDGVATLRPVPSGGARHPFETYLLVNYVEDLEPGLYMYLPIDHSVARLGDQIPPEKVMEGCHGQVFCGECPVTFVWSVIPYRTEWRYGPVSHKVIALDAGHLCQNLYIACTALDLGTCGIGAYDQEMMDGLLCFDGVDEFTIYIAPVGVRR